MTTSQRKTGFLSFFYPSQCRVSEVGQHEEAAALWEDTTGGRCSSTEDLCRQREEAEVGLRVLRRELRTVHGPKQKGPKGRARGKCLAEL